MCRSVGGIVGIALLQTGLARNAQLQQHNLVSGVTVYSEPLQQVVEKLQAGFMATGSAADMASRQSMAVVYQMVQAQAQMLAYIHVFSLVGVIALLMFPLAWLLHQTADGTSAAK